MNRRKLLFIAASLFATATQAQNLSGKIVFSIRSGASPATDSICTIDPNGSNFSFVTHGCFPRLSPNGTYLAFVYGTNSNRKLNHLYFKDPTGSPYEFYNNGSQENLYNFDFTPTETTLLFDWQNGFYIQLANDPQGQTINAGSVGVGDLADEFPRLSPTDSMIVTHNPNHGLRTMPYNGPNSSAVPNSVPGDLSPSWSSDGQWIYFAKQYAGATDKLHNIYRIHSDGTGLQQITNLPNTDTLGMSIVVTKNGEWVVAPARINGVTGLYRFRAHPTTPVTTGYLIRSFNYLPTPCNNLWLGSVDSVYHDPLAVSELPQAVTSLYPNPANDRNVIVVLADAAENVQLFDVTGRSVMNIGQLKKGKNSITLPLLSTGVYYISGKTPSGTFKEKIQIGSK